MPKNAVAKEQTLQSMRLQLTEKQFQNQVVALARALGYRVYHPWLSIRSEKGWPDLAIFKPGRFLLAELKAEKGKLTDQQKIMIEELRNAGIEVHVWRPCDWDDIVSILNYQQTVE